MTRASVDKAAFCACGRWFGGGLTLVKRNTAFDYGAERIASSDKWLKDTTSVSIVWPTQLCLSFFSLFSFCQQLVALSPRFDFAAVQVHQLQQVSRHPWWCSLHSRQFDFKWPPFLPLFIAKFWSRYNTSIPTPNQSSSPLWIAASTPDTVPAIPCPLVKRWQPLHQSLCNVWSPPGQSWWSSGGSAFKISALV